MGILDLIMSGGKLAQMPGIVSGFGGGTFNLDGSQVPEPNRVTAPVTPDAGPSMAVPASAAPHLTKKRGGLLGALESIFMPQADSLWASALRNGIYDAHAGQDAYRQGVADNSLKADSARAEATLKNAQAQRELAKPDWQIAGNNVVTKGPDGQPQIIAPPQAPTETMQLIELFRKRQAANPNDPTLPLISRAIKGYQYTDPVIQAQAAARTGTAVAAANARGAQARMTKRTPGAGSAKTSSIPSGWSAVK